MIMKKEKVINLGILGLGVVGSELVSQIRKNASKIKQETNVSLNIEKIFVRTLSRSRTIDTSGLQLTTNIDDIINNPSIEIVCECMGGNGFKQTREYVLQSMTKGKHLVMSSKKTLANFAELLLKTANENHVHLKYDASVGGGIPIAKVLEHAFKGDKVLKVMGIFNATSNYIYSKMFQENMSFNNALKLAQDKGYAENDPSDDVDGYDSLYKLSILAMFGMKRILIPSDLIPDSFADISIKDMQYAQKLGYRIKPIALVRQINDTFEYQIGPCLIPSEHIIADTFNNYNTIILEGENCGELAFYGQGAGAKPTATVMFDDLMNIITSGRPTNSIPILHIEPKKLVKYRSKLYWRFSVKNSTSQLPTITTIFAENKVNIEKITEKKAENEVDLVLLTTNADAPEINKIINCLKKYDITKNSVLNVV
jgi:homoserine dehydrogenase